MSNKYLVTGGAGFIGSNLVRYLLGKGQQVVVLDHCAPGHENNIADFREKVILVQGDIRDRDAVTGAMEGCDGVFHQAALASVPASVDDPMLAHDVNVNGTMNILEAARSVGLRRIVFASSSAVYGDFPEQPKVETHQCWSVSPYAAGKMAGESYMQSYAAALGMEAVCLRYFNIFGPYQSPAGQYSGAIPGFLSRMLRGERPWINGDGENTRDFCFVDNVCEANWIAATMPAERCDGLPLNIASGSSVTLNEVFRLLCELLELDMEPEYRPPRQGDIRHSSASITRAREVLDWRPTVQLKEGLARTIEWFRKSVAL